MEKRLSLKQVTTGSIPVQGTMSILDLMAEAYAKPDPLPFLFTVGQKVRLKKGRSNDGQTPIYWDGAMVVVVSRYSTGLHKEHWYKLQHDNGKVDEFREEEIDFRYVRKS